MLLWQPKITPKIRFAVRLCVLIALFHLFLLLIALCIGKRTAHLVINTRTDYAHADIILLPWAKEPVKQCKLLAPVKREQKENKPKTALAVQAPKPKAPIAQKEKQKVIEKKAVPEQKAAPEKKTTSPEKKCEQEAVPEQAIYVTHEELSEMQLKEMIAKELKRVWVPPAGLDPELEAVIMITFDMQGKVTALELVKESGVPIYDIQAYTAASSLHPGRGCFGRSITISFKG